LKKAEVRQLYLDKVNSGYADYMIDEIVEVLTDGCGCYYIDVCMLDGKKVVRKMANSETVYLREKKNLKLLEKCPHTPNLISCDDDEHILIMDYVGVALNKLHKKTEDRRQYIPLIQKAFKKMEADFCLYHTDIKWGNITLLNGVVYFVDLASIKVETLIK
jgi:tRNA A-37 threonylcarbamoyl transferase component Bud32